MGVDFYLLFRNIRNIRNILSCVGGIPSWIEMIHILVLTAT